LAFLDSNGFSIRYEAFENKEPENILFIHGNLASSEWWYPSIEILKYKSKDYSAFKPQNLVAKQKLNADHGSLICADWRGYGQSKGLKNISDIDFNVFAQDYINLINFLKLENIVVVGHSTGGLIAMLAILKAPHLFKKLVLLDSVGPQGLNLQLPKEQVLAHFANMQADPDYCKTVLAATIQGCDTSSQTFLKLYQITRQCDPIMWQGVIDVLSDQIDIKEQMQNLNLPTLIIHGEKDLVLPLSGSQELQKLIPNSRLVVVSHQGHSLCMEDPHLFTNLLLEFI
jgi:pimeloyl-ACP methyl ester carboxylesterase